MFILSPRHGQHSHSHQILVLNYFSQLSFFKYIFYIFDIHVFLQLWEMDPFAFETVEPEQIKWIFKTHVCRIEGSYIFF